MTSRVKFGFAADPRAIEDLRNLPGRVRDLALLHLQDLVHGEQRGQRLGERAGVDLSGCRKVYADPDARWRIVYQERQAPPGAPRDREIYLITVGRRDGAEVYNTAAQRLGRSPDLQRGTATIDVPVCSSHPSAGRLPGPRRG
jgi:hypothetical protein